MDENCGFHEEQKAGISVKVPEHSRHEQVGDWTECMALDRCDYHSRLRECEDARGGR
jgi:hypothetical protein